ncbi:hypothetical protein [Mycolicibacterium sphagni]|uniref:Uncharacterized protein n=1 Tax=Mycolicibacterium sphagni TaxID=1786 RepID=A0A255DA40_9MYCO|nr:hypothetical protein [Mycolicibacterium sphagni]OYN76236.1 hypothetical protein CG716_23125 [Mycolicibacterium sphagni]
MKLFRNSYDRVVTVVAFMFSPGPTVGFLQDEAICAALVRELIAEARDGRPVAAAIRSGGLLLHNFAYRCVEVREIESVNGLPAFGWLQWRVPRE